MGACSKNEKTIISGRVVEHYQGNPVANAEINLSYSSFSEGIYSSGYTVIGNVVADSSGYFSFEFDNISAVDFRFQISADDYFFKETKINRDQISNGDKNDVDLDIYAVATISFHFENLYNYQNQLLFALEDHSPNCSECCFSGSVFMNGITDTLITCRLYGHEKLDYTASIIKTSGTEKSAGIIHVEPGENSLYLKFD